MDAGLLLKDLRWLGHASFCFVSGSGAAVYFDPYQIKDGLPKADLILVSHDHFDHCSPQDIAKLAKPGTVIAGPKAIAPKVPGDVRILAPGEELNVGGIKVEAVSAYNVDKQFHPRSAGYLGFIAEADGIRIYHAGDTDRIPEMKGIKADVALLPVGGTYTMDAGEAAAAAADIKPKVAVPMHYGSVVGSKAAAEEFQRLCPCEAAVLAQR